MGTKNISLRKSAYERLVSLKREDESFSDVVEKLTKEKTPRYSDLEGLLSEETIGAIEKARSGRREVDRSEFGKVAEQFESGEE